MPAIGSIAGSLRRRGIRRVGLVGVSLAMCAATVGMVAQGEGTPPATFDLQTGTAWVESTVGLMTLLDGYTGEVVARVDVGRASEGLVAAQAEATGYAVDGVAGTVVRVDPRTFRAGAPVAALSRSSGQVSAYATSEAVYLLDEDQGRLAVVDGDDLVPLGAEQSLAESSVSSVVDDQGRLWLLGGSSGDLVWYSRDDRGERAGVVDRPASAELVVADGAPVVVDRAARRVRAVAGDGGFGGEACLDVDPGDSSVRVGGSEAGRRVYVVSGRQGVVRVSDLGSGTCRDVAVSVFDPGAILGVPVESAGRVFVPNYTEGTVAVVDVAAGEVVVTSEPVAEGAFELFARDDMVFYNDRNSDKAGVIHVDGTFTAVAKYDPADPRADVDNPGGPGATPPAPDDPAGDDAGPDGTEPDGPGGTQPDGTVPDGSGGTLPDGSPATVPGGTGGSVSGPSGPVDPDDTRPPRPGEVPPGGGSVPPPGGGTTSTSEPPGSTPTTTPTTAPPPPPQDSTPPSVSLTPDPTVTSDGRVTVSAQASDAGSGVRDVTLHADYRWQCGGSTSRGSASPVTVAGASASRTLAPPSFSCPSGSAFEPFEVTVFATAVDNAGLAASSQNRTLSFQPVPPDTTAPTVTMTATQTSPNFDPDRVLVSAQASDVGSGVQKIILQANYSWGCPGVGVMVEEVTHEVFATSGSFEFSSPVTSCGGSAPSLERAVVVFATAVDNVDLTGRSNSDSFHWVIDTR